MSALQIEAIQLLNGLSDDDLAFVINMIMKRRASQHTGQTEGKPRTGYKPGMFKGREWCAPDYDLDEDNEEIAALFEGMA